MCSSLERRINNQILGVKRINTASRLRITQGRKVGWHSCAKNITARSDNFLFLSDSHQQLKLLHREMTSRYGEREV